MQRQSNAYIEVRRIYSSQSDTEVLGVYLAEMYEEVGYKRHKYILTVDVRERERVCGSVG